MLKILVRATNNALCAVVEDYVYAEEGITLLARDRLIYDTVYEWMLDYCEDADDAEYIEQSRIEIVSIEKE